MKIITLGKTNLKVNKNGFGALPIQRVSEKEAIYLPPDPRQGGEERRLPEGGLRKRQKCEMAG